LPAGDRGILVFDSTVNILKVHDGTGWVSLGSGGSSYTAGSGHTLAGSVFKAGGTMSEALSFNNVNTYTWQVDNAGTARLHVKANGNVVIGGTSDGGGYNLNINGIWGSASGGATFAFNGASNVLYDGGTGNATFRFGNNSKFFHWVWTSADFKIFPVTDDTRPLIFQKSGGTDVLKLDYGNSRNELTGALKLSGLATAPGTYKVLVHSEASDSLTYQVPLSSLTAAPKLTVVTADPTDWTAAVSTLTKLPDLTGVASHTVTLPSAASNSGLTIIIWNTSTDATFKWTYAAAITLADGTTSTTFADNTLHRLISDGSVWIKTN
jgi:hypothetical protein